MAEFTLNKEDDEILSKLESELYSINEKIQELHKTEEDTKNKIKFILKTKLLNSIKTGDVYKVTASWHNEQDKMYIYIRDCGEDYVIVESIVKTDVSKIHEVFNMSFSEFKNFFINTDFEKIDNESFDSIFSKIIENFNI